MMHDLAQIVSAEAFGDRDRREVRVRPWDGGHDRGVGDDETVDAEHAALRVDDASDPTRPRRVEVVANAPADVALELLLPRRDLGREQSAKRPPRGDLADQLDRLDDDREIRRIAQQAALDLRQRERVGRSEPDATGGARLDVEDADARLVPAGRRSLVRPREQVQVPAPGRAAGAGRLHQAVRLEQRPGAPDVLGGRPGEELGRLPAHAGAVVVEQLLAHRERGNRRDPVPRQLGFGPDPAPQQDRRGEVRARGEDDHVGVDPFPGCRDDSRRARAVERESVDRGVGGNGEIRPAPSRVEVRERRIPARPLDHVRRKRGAADRLHRIVGVVERGESRLAGCLEEGDMEGRGLGRVGGLHAEQVACAPQVGRESLVAPLPSPLVVVLGGADHRHAGVVGRAAADHPRAERPVVLAARAPVVRERERARIEEIVGPGA